MVVYLKMLKNHQTGGFYWTETNTYTQNTFIHSLRGVLLNFILTQNNTHVSLKEHKEEILNRK